MPWLLLRKFVISSDIIKTKKNRLCLLGWWGDYMIENDDENHYDNYMDECRHVMWEMRQGKYAEPFEKIVDILVGVRERKGRVFLVGFGGSASNCQHFANDLRKICNI